MTIGAEGKSGAYLSVYQVLDEIGFGKTVPVGSQGAMFAAIDGLRRTAAPAEHIRLAECISVAIHRLLWALKTGEDEETVRAELQTLGASWLRIPVPSTVH